MIEGLDKALATIKKRARSNELTYSFLMDCLKDYKNPRMKLRDLMTKGAIIGVKKGLYVLSKLHAVGPYCPELMANLVYGPSYISLETALSHYQVIPEHTTQISSVTTKRSKTFETPIGNFKYKKSHPKRYHIGVNLLSVSKYQSYLLAVPEKALADLLIIERGKVSSLSSLKETLFEDLRIDEETLLNFDVCIFKKLHAAAPHSSLVHMIHLLEQMQ